MCVGIPAWPLSFRDRWSLHWPGLTNTGPALKTRPALSQASVWPGQCLARPVVSQASKRSGLSEAAERPRSGIRGYVQYPRVPTPGTEIPRYPPHQVPPPGTTMSGTRALHGRTRRYCAGRARKMSVLPDRVFNRAGVFRALAGFGHCKHGCCTWAGWPLSALSGLANPLLTGKASLCLKDQ